MGHVWGMMSPKILLSAGALIASARVEMHSVSATVDPSVEITRISPDLAPLVRASPGATGPQSVRGREVGLDASGFRLPFVLVDPALARNSIVIGSDLLSQAPMRFDLGRGKLRMFATASEFRRAVRGLVPTPATISADGCLSLAATEEPGHTVRMAFVGERRRSGEREPRAVMLAGAPLTASVSRYGDRCQANDAVLSWADLAPRTVVFDLPHRQIWIGRD